MYDLARSAGKAIKAGQGALAGQALDCLYGGERSSERAVDEARRQASLRDFQYHLSYLAEALSFVNPWLFSDYVAWCKLLFAGLHFGDDALAVTFRCLISTLDAALPAELSAMAREYIEGGLRRAQSAPTTTRSYINEDAPLAGLASDYLNSLLAGDQRGGANLIQNAIEKGVSLRQIYLYVFQPCQYELGRLWQASELTPGQEHFCTSVTRDLMGRFSPWLTGPERAGRRLAAACLSGELHDLGLRMVCDFFEMAGWDTYFMGANTPASSIVSLVNGGSVDVLALSATTPLHLSAVSDLIASIRLLPAGRRLRILAGGYVFNAAPGLAQSLGADGTAHDALEAVEALGGLTDQ